METLILTLDTIALMVVLYFSYKVNKAPGQPELGPFRIRSLEPGPPLPPAASRQPARRQPQGRQQQGRKQGSRR